MDTLSHLALKEAPPLDPAWLKHEDEAGLNGPKPVFASLLDRQPVYAADRRRVNASMLVPGAPYHHLSSISSQSLTAPSTVDNFQIPILRFSAGTEDPDVVFVYYHGGGLFVGEADSEELSCRRIAAEIPGATVYSVGYRLMPTNPASTSVSDSVDAFNHVRSLHPSKKIILVGSSSGGQLAATISQLMPRRTVHGVVLRGPVTSDGGTSLEFVPERFREYYTSASPSFVTSLLGVFTRAVPRDGLDKLPLEAETAELKGLPRTWVQVCTNDTIYSDGVCYAAALREAGVEVRVDVVKGWPHTFWIKAPGLQRAIEAEEEMIKGVKWVLEG
ncbi:AB hydrolase superfamily protein 5 [Colletotrichum chlorophyti]|uniref:AB hydrolase superfamily protein 5 n=1 Tax=Colletotrichum chlorophyti TaxID=708187 RepID=A0A1Q8RQF4_9PEZI|nr:AB hydrolase superfamily protein 5 [Colletotrichum chlorophyti]